MGAILNVGVGLAQLLGSGNEAEAERQQGLYQQKIFNENADQLEKQADEVTRIGAEDATRYGEGVRSLVGKQASSYAAQGVDVATGSAADVQRETSARGMQDIITIKDNAWREAFGFKQQARNERQQGVLAAKGGNARASSTLATGGLNFAGSLAKGFGDWRKG